MLSAETLGPTLANVFVAYMRGIETREDVLFSGLRVKRFGCRVLCPKS